MLDRLPSLVNHWFSVESKMHQYLPKFLTTLLVWEHITQQPGLHKGFI